MRDESRLYATRRHWRSATLLFVGLVVGAMALRVSMTDENLYEYAPTWFLSRSLRFASSTATDPIREALHARIVRRTLTPEEIRDISERILAGDGSATPTSLAWQSRYGPLLDSLMSQALVAVAEGRGDDPALVSLESFRQLPPLVTVTAPQAWPVNEPLVVEVDLESWWPPMTYARVRVRDESDGTERIMAIDSGAGDPTRYPFSFSPVREGETSRRITVSVETRKTALDGSRDPNEPWGKPIVTTVPVQIAAAPPIELQPFTSDAADDAMRSVFSQGLVAWRQGWRRYGLMFDATRAAEVTFAGTLIGLDIEVLEGTAVRRRSRIWWPGGPGSGRTLARWEILFEDSQPLAGLTVDSPGWSVRIRGSREIAVRALTATTINTTAGASSTAKGVADRPEYTRDYTRYWSGDVTVPLSVRINEGASPRRRWFVPRADDLPTELGPATDAADPVPSADHGE